MVGHRDQFGVRTVGHGSDDAITNLSPFDTWTDFDHGAGALVADNVRVSGERAAQTIERVTTFDADRLDLDQNETGAGDGVGNVLVLQNFGWTILVIDGGLHAAEPTGHSWQMGLEHLPASADPEKLVEVLRRDGAVIIDDVLDAATVAEIRAEFEPLHEATATGEDGFTGLNTRRFGALIERAPSTRPLVMHPLVLAVARGLLEQASAIQLHLTQAICIGPNSPMQGIHRDEWAFDFFAFPRGFEVQCNTIWAITDFTEANGATRVAPGSGRLEEPREWTLEDTVAAEMSAGSVILYTGSVYHGGGPNTTDDQVRMGAYITYNLGWLRQEENQYLAVSRECAATLDEDLLRLMGYQRGAFALGYIDDLRDPISVVRPEFSRKSGFGEN